MSPNGEADGANHRGLCAMLSLPDSDGDLPCLQKKRFREDGGSLRGEGRPFSKRGPFPPQAVPMP